MLVVLTIGIFLAIVAYPCWLVTSAFLEVKAAPRKEMHYCPVHGPLLKEHMVLFMDSPVCPTCLHTRLKNAESGKL